MMRFWITDEPQPSSQIVIDVAIANQCGVILHGIPASLSDQIPQGTLGAYEVVEPTYYVDPSVFEEEGI